MGLKHGDLKDTIVKDISFDQYEPKTGDSKDTIVMAFQTPEQGVGQDLYSFLNNGNKLIKDIDVSPNKNQDDYYMVFLEFDRKPEAIELIQEILSDVENLTGKLGWQGTSHIHETAFPVDENLSQYIFTSPDDYVTKDEYQEQQNNEEKTNGIMEFLKASSLDGVDISENIITLRKGNNTAKLDIVGFGNKDIMQDVGISESAIEPLDNTMRTFNSMLGDVRAVRIAEHIVIFHPQKDTLLVTKECSDF